MKSKVAFFVDGFNVYHAIKNIVAGDIKKNYLKWIDLRKLFERFIDNKTEEIADIYYFTATPDHIRKTGVLDRYNALVRVYMQHLKIKVVKGKFKKKHARCPKCHQRYEGHEEKQSDVNLCLYLLKSAYENWYDRMVLVTQDSDMAPVAKMVQTVCPGKLTLLTPPELSPSKEISKILGSGGIIKEAHLGSALLDAIYYNKDGRVAVIRPVEYDPPC